MPKKRTQRAASANAGGSTATRRKRRSPDQIIADLEAEIRRVREKAKAREIKESPAIRTSLTAIRNLDKALDAAAEEQNARLRHALADARRALGGYLEESGIKLPKPNLPKGPRPKS